jgi:serine/threonine-protein kinase
MPAAAGFVRCHKCGGTLLENEDRALDMSDELTPGKELGSYRIVKLLGEGGMGRVYVAEHMRLGRRVALKMLRQEFAVNPVAVSRFFAEARAVNRISHEHLVEITDFFEKPGGENYFIMELLKGEDLGKHLLRSGALPVARAIDIAHQTASVLAAVHAAHIVHRDLKPDNIFLVERASRPDFVKLLDFGVAKLSDTYDGIKMKTTTAGAVIGTPEYMSPEQAGGLPVDQRTDIYALGVIMYEVLSGRLPFEAKSFGEMVIKHMTVAPRPLAEHELKESIPAALESLVMALLEKDPDHRPQTMAEVEEVLQGLVDYVVPAETRVTGQMPVLRRPTKPGLDASDRSQRIPVVSITGREPTVEIAPSTSGAIPAAGLAAASGPIPVVAAETATAIKRRPVRLLAIVGCAMAVAALVTWLAMRDGGYEAEPSTNATITPARPEPAAAKPAPAPAPVPAPITPVAPPVALPVSEPVAATPPPPPPPPASPAKAVASRPPAPSRTAPTPPPHKAAQKSQPTPQVDRSGTMDVFGDN